MILVFDFGSSSFKAALYGRHGACVGEASAPAAPTYGAGGRVELPVERVRDALARVIGEVLTAARCDRDAIAAIGITSQAQTFAVFGADGRPRTPFFSWQDTRSESCRAPLQEMLPDIGDHCSFAGVMPNLQLCQCRRLAVERRFCEDERIVPLPSYVAWQLTGQFVIDENLAAMSGLFCLQRREWWGRALRLCGLQDVQLPRPVPLGEVATPTTEAAEDWYLPAGRPLILAGNDQTMGAYGVQLRPAKDILLTLGTAQVAYVVDDRLAPATPGVVRGPYPEGHGYRLVADNVGGSVVDWAARLLTPFDGAAGLDALAATVTPGAEGVSFVPDLAQGRGRWEGLGLHHGPAPMACAVFEGLARRLHRLSAALGGEGYERVLVAGGGRQSQVWRTALGELFGGDLHVCDTGPLAGAARLVGNIVGQP